jgi:hypothetical protein
MKAEGRRRAGIYKRKGVQNVENVDSRLKLFFRLAFNVR